MNRLTEPSLSHSARRLAAIDSELGSVVERLGVPPLWGRPASFATLIKIILEQQVSLAAAATMFQRLEDQLGAVTADVIATAGQDGLRMLGLTRQKSRYCCELATRLLDGRLDLEAVAKAPEAEGRAMLLAVPGLGPWSVDVYYLMALRHPDIWPQGDLALAIALRELKSLESNPDHDRQLEMVEAWRPWRSVAARILWMNYLAARGKYPD